MRNDYIPEIVKIQRIVRETPDVKTFHLDHVLDFVPGQFLEISSFGAGEAPISIASGPQEGLLKISFKRVGKVTDSLFRLKEKDGVGIRGPFGNGFPIDQLDGKDIIFIAGGIGLAPLRSLIAFILSRKRMKVGDMTLLYGARNPRDILYKKELKKLGKRLSVLLTVDNPDKGWKAHTGLVPQLLNEVRLKISDTKAFVCGPEIMMRFTTAKLIKSGFSPCDIILSLERYMTCGTGKCGHCYISDKFVCRDGPVFTYDQLNKLVPAEVI